MFCKCLWCLGEWGNERLGSVSLLAENARVIEVLFLASMAIASRSCCRKFSWFSWYQKRLLHGLKRVRQDSTAVFLKRLHVVSPMHAGQSAKATKSVIGLHAAFIKASFFKKNKPVQGNKKYRSAFRRETGENQQEGKVRMSNGWS